MKFFVPNAASPEQAEEVWQSVHAFAVETMERPVSDRRIYEIHYRHNGDDLVATVGEPEPLTKEPVIVILESNPFLICTPLRGVVRELPILAGLPYRVVDFEPADSTTGSDRADR